MLLCNRSCGVQSHGVSTGDHAALFPRCPFARANHGLPMGLEIHRIPLDTRFTWVLCYASFLNPSCAKKQQSQTPAPTWFEAFPFVGMLLLSSKATFLRVLHLAEFGLTCISSKGIQPALLLSEPLPSFCTQGS